MTRVPDHSDASQSPPTDRADASAPKTGSGAKPRPLTRFLRSSAFVKKWGPLIISIISLVLTGVHAYLDNVAPPVDMVMPVFVRLVATSPRGTTQNVIIQPTFINRGTNQRTEVISNLDLQISSNSEPKAVTFSWFEMGTLTLNPNKEDIDYGFLSDPSPLLITASAPMQPIARFRGPSNWTFEAGKYHITLVAQRNVASTPLTGRIDITLTNTMAQNLKRNDGRNYIIRVDR